MFVNDINTGIVLRQHHAELAERAAEERLAREVVRARRAAAKTARTRTPLVLRLVGRGASVIPRHRTAH